MSRILLVEDDADIAAMEHAVLSRAGFTVIPATDGVQALRLFHREQPDLVILDIGLPGLDGWQVLERIRELADTPILMLSSFATEADKVRGLRGGADDYLTKPFGNRELVARVEVLLRRGGPKQPGNSVYDDGVVRVRYAEREVTVNGARVALTPLEFRLLDALIRHRGQVLSAEQLLEHAWKDPFAASAERVKFSVLRLRRKLGWAQPAGSPIEAVRGFGYRYVAPISSAQREP